MKEKRAQSANKNFLGSLIKSAAMIYGFYQLSNLTIFTGKDFLKKDLTDEQIKAMDVHNESHIKFGRVRDFGQVLVGDVEAAKIINNRMQTACSILDIEIESLPSPLNHKHKDI